MNFPASDPLVLAVGGTSLRASRITGVYQGETTWNTPLPPAQERLLPADLEPPVASGGEFSSLFPRPSYQVHVAGITAARGVPDVAGDASPYTRIGRGYSYHRAFHDVTTGNNTVRYPGGTITGYRAGPGWDPVTGWGTPDANVLVPLLAADG